MVICSYEIIRHVFRFLNGNDLRSASQISRVWWEAAHLENYSRGPFINIFRFEDDLIYFPENIEQFFNKPIPIMFNFNFMFIFKEILDTLISGCPCQYLPANSHKLILQIFFPLSAPPIIVNLSLPDSYKIQVNTYSFVRFGENSTIFCPELRSMSYSSFNLSPIMRDEFVRYFDNNSSMKTVMILLGQMDHANTLIDLVRQLANWFPNNNIPIWGGITREMVMCGKYPTVGQCSSFLGCIFLFISNKELKTWHINLSTLNRYIESTLETFVQTVQLKKHSLGFIYTTSTPGIAVIDCKLFEKYFPNISYVHYNGPASYVEQGLQDILKNLYKWRPLYENGPLVLNDEETSIMILTYS